MSALGIGGVIHFQADAPAGGVHMGVDGSNKASRSCGDLDILKDDSA